MVGVAAGPEGIRLRRAGFRACLDPAVQGDNPPVTACAARRAPVRPGTISIDRVSAFWVEVVVNGIPMPATGEPRVVHTPLGTHVALDLTATSVSIRNEDGK